MFSTQLTIVISFFGFILPQKNFPVLVINTKWDPKARHQGAGRLRVLSNSIYEKCKYSGCCSLSCWKAFRHVNSADLEICSGTCECEIQVCHNFFFFHDISGNCLRGGSLLQSCIFHIVTVKSKWQFQVLHARFIVSVSTIPAGSQSLHPHTLTVSIPVKLHMFLKVLFSL